MAMKHAPFVVLFVAACHLDPATTTPETYADFLKLSSQLTCAASLRCCGTLCTPQSDAEFYRASARMFDYLNAGLWSYDRQAAVDCLAALQQRYTNCDTPVIDLPPSTACSRVLVPQGGPGARCETGINVCRADTVCTNSTCTFRRAEGDACTISNVTCASPNDSCCNACTGVCSAGLPIGAICSPGVNQCRPGALCLSSTQRCTAYAENGQPCSLMVPCNPTASLFCLPSSQTCGPPQPNGASCTDAAQCMSTYCQLATSPGTCQPLPAPPTVREQLCVVR